MLSLLPGYPAGDRAARTRFAPLSPNCVASGQRFCDFARMQRKPSSAIRRI